MANATPTQFEQKAYVFYTMLNNAYRDEEDMLPALPKLSLELGGDLTEDLTAMMMAMLLFCKHHAPDAVKNIDTIGFSHFLNRLAIQRTFANVMDQVDVFEDEE